MKHDARSARRWWAPARFLSLVVVVLAVAPGADAQTRPVGVTVPLQPDMCRDGRLLEKLAPSETGISFLNQLSNANLRRYTYNGGGVAAGDYDGDGRADIYLVNEEGPSKLYRNAGGMRFEDVTAEAGLVDGTGPGGFSVGAHFADVDNDGDLDLFLTNWIVSNRLFRNDGDGTFTDITEIAGVGYEGGATTSTFADYDRDGDLDFFVATYRPRDYADEVGTPELEVVDGRLAVPDSLQDRLDIVQNADGRLTLRQLGETDLLYRNNGDGTFTEVAEEAGIEGRWYGLSAIFVDMDDDGWPDLYVTNDFWTPDGFYRNRRDGTFEPVPMENVQHTPWFAMGVDFADINNDGRVDYFVGDMFSRDHTLRMTQHGLTNITDDPPDFPHQVMRNGLYLNNGNGSFSDIAWMAGVAATEWTWTAKFSDLDLDGFVDLLITNGMIYDLMDSDVAEQEQIARAQGDVTFRTQFPPLINRDLVFRNNGDLTFSDRSEEWGFNEAAIGHGAALADLDGDGDMDVVVNYLNDTTAVYCNNASSDRLAVRLQGRTSNQLGIGARISLTTDAGIQVRHMTTSGGYLSSHEPVVVFGLGEDDEAWDLQVEWPSGHVQSWLHDPTEPLEPNRTYVMGESGAPDRPPPPTETAAPAHFEEVAAVAGLSVPHVESAFDDFASQSLLPRKLSTLGPGVAWGDGDGDGDDDLYVAGAAGQAGTIYRNQGDGRLGPPSAVTDPGREEMAPLWWTDGELGWPTLLLSYSSVEDPTAPLAGRYAVETGRGMVDVGWPESSSTSSGAMAAADFDGDGDLDVFVGGRVEPSRWPVGGSSRLYANEAGTLRDVTESAAPGLNGLGLATGALWSDVDADGDSDLVVATELGPIRLFRNEEGELVERTSEAGLDEWTGLWSGVVSGDFNEDGHIDLAAANIGLNTRYALATDQKVVVYAGNVDGDGDVDVIEAYEVDGTLFPLRDRRAAGQDIPFVLERFSTYREYAEASLEEIYGGRLDEVERFEANTLAHTVFLNDGNGGFSAAPLPDLSQITSGYGLTVADFDNDSHDDLFLVGNFRYADHDTEAYDGGIGYWLRGDGLGGFSVVPAPESGIFVPRDGRGAAVSDYDGDGWVDVVVGVNDGGPLLFRNRGNTAATCAVGIRLEGSESNPTGVGARIMVTRADGKTTTREVQAGGGYMSQNSAVHLFASSGGTVDVVVRWPDGSESTRTGLSGCDVVTIQ